MNDFDKRFKKAQDDFDRDFARVKKMAFVSWVIGVVVAIAGTVFLVWLAFVLLAYFGVI